MERKVFTHLVGKRAAALNDMLTQTGFRRSQTIAYRPACENCRGCVSVRVVVDEFQPSDSQRRIQQLSAALLRGHPGGVGPPGHLVSRARHCHETYATTVLLHLCSN